MAISLIQTAEHLSTTNTTNIVPISASSSGHLITVCFSDVSSTLLAASVTDNLGNTYTHIVGADCQGNGGSQMSTGMFYLQNCPAGITSVTVTYGSSVTSYAYVSEWSGIASSLSLDQSGSNLGTAAGVVWSGPTLVTTNSTELILGIAIANLFALTGVDSPFTKISVASGSKVPIVGYYLASATGSYTAAYEPHTSSGRWASSGSSFIAGSSGPSAKQKSSTFLIY